MCWHADDDPNDGDNDHPIVSLSIGNSCEFGLELDQQVSKIILTSGDALIWGGPQRMLRHAVLKVNLGTSPSYLPLDNVRLNFTFRDAPNILGKEDEWKIKRKPKVLPRPVPDSKPSDQ